MQCLTFSPFNIPRDQIWPWQKWVKVNLGWSPFEEISVVIISLIYIWHYISSFKAINSVILIKKMFYGFYHIWARRSCCSCDHDHLNKCTEVLIIVRMLLSKLNWSLAQMFQRESCLKMWQTFNLSDLWSGHSDWPWSLAFTRGDEAHAPTFISQTTHCFPMEKIGIQFKHDHQRST